MGYVCATSVYICILMSVVLAYLQRRHRMFKTVLPVGQRYERVKDEVMKVMIIQWISTGLPFGINKNFQAQYKHTQWKG